MNNTSSVITTSLQMTIIHNSHGNVIYESHDCSFNVIHINDYDLLGRLQTFNNMLQRRNGDHMIVTLKKRVYFNFTQRFIEFHSKGVYAKLNMDDEDFVTMLAVITTRMFNK